MELLRKLVIAVLVISLFTFVALFGRLPAFRKTPIGHLNRLVLVVLPRALLRADQYVSGGRFTASMRRAGHYLMNENHPLILIFFITLLVASESLFVPSAWEKLDFIHRSLALFLISLPYFFTYKCITIKSSIITPHNHERHMSHYPYDHVLYRPGKLCRTCNLVKPARSKHCSICKVCVAKQDHHCVWVMTCLGRDNYAYFFALLLSLTLLLSYGAYLGHAILSNVLQKNSIRRSQGPDSRAHWSKGLNWASYFARWSWALAESPRIGAVGMLAMLTAPLALGLFVYHVYLVWAGMTTNESFKWSDWKEDVAEGLVFLDDGSAKVEHVSNAGFFKQDVAEWAHRDGPKLLNLAIDNPFYDSPQNYREWKEAPQPPWVLVQDLSEIVNIYDQGFLNNVREVLHLP